MKSRLIFIPIWSTQTILKESSLGGYLHHPKTSFDPERSRPTCSGKRSGNSTPARAGNSQPVRCAGLFSNDDTLAGQLFQAGEATHERLWRMPLDEDYLAGDDADLRNSGGKEATPVIGGMFLKQFVEEGTRWAHLDIAGVADVNKDLPYSQKGATGFGIRLIVKYLEGLE